MFFIFPLCAQLSSVASYVTSPRMTSFLRTTNHTFPAFTPLLYLRRRQYHANRSCFLSRVSLRFSLSFTLEKWQGLCLKWKVICPARIERTCRSGANRVKCARKGGTWGTQRALACIREHSREHLASAWHSGLEMD